MDLSNLGIPGLVAVTVAYWAIGGVIWVKRQRAALHREVHAAFEAVPHPEAATIEVHGSINLLRLAAAALLPPAAAAVLWFVMR